MSTVAARIAARAQGWTSAGVVMGTVLTGRFTDRLPPSLAEHASSPGRPLTVARHLGPAVHTRAVAASTDAMALGFGVIAAVVAVLCAVVVVWFRNGAR